MGDTNVDLALIQKDMDYIKRDVAELTAIVKSFIEKADEKYADKKIEKIVYGAVVAILAGVLGMILTSAGIAS